MRGFWLGMLCLGLAWRVGAAGALTPGQLELANGEWAPYLSESLPQRGFASHIVSEAFRLAGIRVVYRFYPWSRAEAMVRGGEIAGSVVWSVTPERRQFALFSDPVVSDEEVVFHLASRPMRARRVEDFYGLDMATPNGSRLGAWRRAVDAGRIHHYVTKDVQSGMHQLLLGRIDFFPVVRAVGLSELRRHFTAAERAAIVAEPHAFSRFDYCLMISRRQPDADALLARFNLGLARLRASGEYRRMERDFLSGGYDGVPAP
ncbi:substrate-binding periplasmic protein [Chromobacterium sp. CV08]|uniref:substrate-binding periplasmic protein n=1 Tax=Chromobacterium sp. CV08 TaxID=3133274 RepID=UPI003DA92DC9